MPDSVILAIRARRALQRSTVRRTVIAATAAGTALIVGSLARAGTEARDRWGETRPVAVAQRDLEPGEVVDAAAVEVRELPRAVVSHGALDVEPVGSVVRYPVLAGEPLVGDRLAPEGLSGLAALVPEDGRAVSVPIGPLGMPPLQVGDTVEVLVVLPPSGDISGHGDHEQHERQLASTEPAFPLVSGARVIDVGEQAVTIVVARTDAARVAYASANGVVVLALTGA